MSSTASKKAARPKRKSTRTTVSKPKKKKVSRKGDPVDGRLQNIEETLEGLTKRITKMQRSVASAGARKRADEARLGFGEDMSALSDLINSMRVIESNIRDMYAKQPTDRLESALGRAVMLSLLWYRDSEANALEIHRMIVRKVIDTLDEWGHKKDVKTFEGSMDQALARSVFDAFGGYSVLD